jgi:hypothetical protein
MPPLLPKDITWPAGNTFVASGKDPALDFDSCVFIMTILQKERRNHRHFLCAIPMKPQTPIDAKSA